jgi:hypothetical protein
METQENTTATNAGETPPAVFHDPKIARERNKTVEALEPGGTIILKDWNLKPSPGSYYRTYFKKQRRFVCKKTKNENIWSLTRTS